MKTKARTRAFGVKLGPMSSRDVYVVVTIRFGCGAVAKVWADALETAAKETKVHTKSVRALLGSVDKISMIYVIFFDLKEKNSVVYDIRFTKNC